MTTSKEIVRLKITLDDVKPAVMRRVEVPVSIMLDTLHEIIQAIMPWENSHLHSFYLRLIDGPRWAPPTPFGDDFNFGIKARDSTRTTCRTELQGAALQLRFRRRLATHDQGRAAIFGGPPGSQQELGI